MFKLAAFTDEITQDLERACLVCREFGVQGVEIRGVWETPCNKLKDAQVHTIKRLVSDHGLTVCSIASPFGKCELNSAAEWAQHLDILRRCADIGRELGCNLVRGFAFWGHGARQKPWDAILKAFETVPAILEEKDVVLGMENEAACFIGTGQHLRSFLDSMGCSRIKAVWDPANHVHDPESHETDAFPDGYEAVKGDIVHVHVKDAARGPQNTVVNAFMGTGLCRWKEQFRALAEDGYEGYCSLETHVSHEHFPDDLSERYGRFLTGEGREGASRVCLAWICDTLKELGLSVE